MSSDSGSNSTHVSGAAHTIARMENDLLPTITRHAETLKRLLALAFVHLGLANDTLSAGALLGDGSAAACAFRALSSPQSLPRRAHRVIRAMLLPVESATRRLIVALAADLPTPEPSAIKPPAHNPSVTRVRLRRVWTPGVTIPLGYGRPASKPPSPPKRMPRFSLFDPLKRFDRKRYAKGRTLPRVWHSGAERPPPISAPAAQTQDDPVTTRHLLRRVAALGVALDDLPRQARRLARWRAVRDARLAAQAGARSISSGLRCVIRTSTLRVGRPPGSPSLRQPRERHSAVHAALADCAELAWWAQRRHRRETDTS